MTDRFLIIGGGTRLEKAYDAFVQKGFNAEIYTGDEILKTAVDRSDVILLGIPASKDDIYVSSDTLQISLRDLAALCGRRKLLLGGRLSEKTKALFDIYSVRWVDYAGWEEFEILNAVPTAEGAIQIAMEEFPFTLHSSKVLITGYGKVSRALCARLDALGANCTVVARSASARAEAEASGFNAVDFTTLPDEAKKCQIIFNTVPAQVIGKETLSCLTPRQGIIDLASKPGGVDLDSARAFGVNVIWALGLPGKVAPTTAGEIIQKTACNIARELRLNN